MIEEFMPHFGVVHQEASDRVGVNATALLGDKAMANVITVVGDVGEVRAVASLVKVIFYNKVKMIIGSVVDELLGIPFDEEGRHGITLFELMGDGGVNVRFIFCGCIIFVGEFARVVDEANISKYFMF